MKVGGAESPAAASADCWWESILISVHISEYQQIKPRQWMGCLQLKRMLIYRNKIKSNNLWTVPKKKKLDFCWCAYLYLATEINQPSSQQHKVEDNVEL